MHKYLAVLLIMLSVHLSAQTGESVWMVKLREGEKISQLMSSIRSQGTFTTPLVRCISNSAMIYSVRVPDETKTLFVEEMKQRPEVIWITEDVPLQMRQIPDDPFLEEQWHLEKIDAFNAWDITTGGLTPLGDTIVIAVIDDGFMAAHTDLGDNVWRNYAELPGDGKDNDNNGYIDDFVGLNITTGKDNHPIRSHGTTTAALIGAIGNNGKGVTGINWKVKLLLISEANSAANVIEAYEYVLALRKLYNESNGTKGAYIVATNLSAGIDAAFPEDNPLFIEWCGLYDKLGAVGIININAVPNSNVDIDKVGDMPSTCASGYLIKVTMTDPDDLKDEEGGYGKQYVNLAAPGRNIYSATTNNQYGLTSGTSNAAPLVTGTVGLLYAAPCNIFADLAKNDPPSAAQAVRSMILEGVDKLATLGAYTSTGGRLNIMGAFTKMRDLCQGSSGSLDIVKVFPNPASQRMNLLYETDNYDQHHFRIANALGQNVIAFNFYPPFFGEKKLELDIEKYTFPIGIYFVTISSGSRVSTRKVLMY